MSNDKNVLIESLIRQVYTSGYTAESNFEIINKREPKDYKEFVDFLESDVQQAMDKHKELINNLTS